MRSENHFLCDRVQDTNEINPEFEALLDYLKQNHNFDLMGYKRSSLMRRFQHRMQSVNIDTYRDYLQYLKSHSEEYPLLLDAVLINVTSFFRDQSAWDYLATEVIPKIIASKQPNELIRVWSAGCAAGQEIYSLLMLLAEAIGIEACLQQVRCFATDADEAVLWQARQATYSSQEVIGIPPELLEKYFQQTEKGYLFHPELRHSIIFSRHDLARNAPISKIDLLMCRNVLIYFNPEAQASILVRFHFALKNTGFLFLGKSETLINRRQIFTPVNHRHRIYRKGLKLELEDHLSITPKSYRKQSTTELPRTQNQFWQTAFETSPLAQFAVDLNGCLISSNEQANYLFGLTLQDWNRPFAELEPGKLVGSDTVITGFSRNQQPVILKNIEWKTSESTKYFDISIAPVFSQKQVIGTTLTFIDVSDHKQLSEELKLADARLERTSETLEIKEAELEAAYQEIQLLIQEIRD